MVGRITSIVLPDKDGVKREPNILEKSDLRAWLQVLAATGRGGGPTQSPPHPGRVVAAALRCRAAAVPQDLFQDTPCFRESPGAGTCYFAPGCLKLKKVDSQTKSKPCSFIKQRKESSITIR